MPLNSPTLLEQALAHHRAGRVVQAEAIYRRVLGEDPANADALHLLGSLIQEADPPQALGLMRRAAEIDPVAAHFHCNLGALLGRMGRGEEAIVCLREALRLKPHYLEALSNLGVALEQLGKVREAVEAHDKALALRPEYVESLHHRGSCLRKLGRLEEAIQSLVRVTQLNPRFAGAYHALAAAYGEQGNQQKVIECHRKLMGLSPKSAPAHSDLLHVLHYDPASPPQELFEQARHWAKLHTDRLTPAHPRHANDRNPDRPLRVGYISPDFHDHPVARLMMPILMHMDRSHFHSVCYDDSTRPDETTSRLKEQAGEWKQTAGLSDAALAQLIRDDRIDILVDLTGHMGGHRLTMFARKPAPVQVTHFNYPDTTGMSAMDYRLTDALAEPVGVSERYSTEKLVRLPYCGWCYHPGFEVPEVGRLPAIANGYITFTSLNKPLKHSRPSIALWAKILHEVPKSRLLLLGTDVAPANPALSAPFAAHGIGQDRLLFMAKRPRFPYLDLYNLTDIALDPFPYNGGITSCDAMWMGVALVALEGNTYHSRQGLMLLTNLGLPELVAKTPEQYVQIARALAGDVPRLASLRAELRARMERSPMADGPQFAAELAAAYRRMWASWCGK
jgi:predicted O-linked N-acetylglucosamine transferase (SPINDLY family)